MKITWRAKSLSYVLALILLLAIPVNVLTTGALRFGPAEAGAETADGLIQNGKVGAENNKIKADAEDAKEDETAGTDSPQAADAGDSSWDDSDRDSEEADVPATIDEKHWIDVGTEYQYRAEKDQSEPSLVMNWKELRDAVERAGSYAADKPCVILIGADITMEAACFITDKNIVLRKEESAGGTVSPVSQAAIIPPQNSDVPWNLTAAADNRHFIVDGSNCKLTLENVTLDGGVMDIDSGKVGGGDVPVVARGGIYSEAAHFMFSGNIWRCSQPAEGILYQSGPNHARLDVVGGTFSENQVVSGTIGSDPKLSGAKIHVSAAIIENNYAAKAGAGICVSGQRAECVAENVTIRNNTAYGGPAGIAFLNSGTVNLEQGTVLSGNHALRPNDTQTGQREGGRNEKETKKRVNLYTAMGGGIGVLGISGPAVLNVREGAQIVNNTAERGGGIAVGAGKNTVSLYLYGGVISDNEARARDGVAMSTGSALTRTSAGLGGGIYAANLKDIQIPKDCAPLFLNNRAPFITLTDLATTPGKENGPPKGDDYVSHIQNPALQTSLRGEEPYGNLYNNYDIGVRNSGSLALLSLGTIPSDGSGGLLVQSPLQTNRFVDVFGDNRCWAFLSDPPMEFEVKPQAGYVFAGWAGENGPAARDGLFQVQMPQTPLNLTAVFKKRAHLSMEVPSFAPVYPGGHYTQPDALPIALTNSGEMSAATLTASLSGAAAEQFVLTKTGSAVAGGTTNNAILRIQPKEGLAAGRYSATVSVSYDDDDNGDTAMFTVEQEVVFVVQETSVPSPAMPLVTSPASPSDAGFAPATDMATAQGKTPASLSVSAIEFGDQTMEDYMVSPNMESISIRNTGGTDARITGVSLSGINADDFFLYTGYQSIVPAHDSLIDGWNYTWLVTPKRNLSAGLHMAEINIAYEDGAGSPQVVSASAFFPVQPRAVLKSAVVDGQAKSATSSHLTLTFAHPVHLTEGGILMEGAKLEATPGALAATQNDTVWTLALTTSDENAEGNPLSFSIPLAKLNGTDGMNYQKQMTEDDTTAITGSALLHVRHELDVKSIRAVKGGGGKVSTSIEFSLKRGGAGDSRPIPNLKLSELKLSSYNAASAQPANLTTAGLVANGTGPTPAAVTAGTAKGQDTIGEAYVRKLESADGGQGYRWRIVLDQVVKSGYVTLSLDEKYGVIGAPAAVSVSSGASQSDLPRRYFLHQDEQGLLRDYAADAQGVQILPDDFLPADGEPDGSLAPYASIITDAQMAQAKVYLDGALLDSSLYEAKAGTGLPATWLPGNQTTASQALSNPLTLTFSLKGLERQLKSGWHDITVLMEDGQLRARFYRKAPAPVQTQTTSGTSDAHIAADGIAAQSEDSVKQAAEEAADGMISNHNMDAGAKGGSPSGTGNNNETAALFLLILAAFLGIAAFLLMRIRREWGK